MKALIVASYADSLRNFRGPLVEALAGKLEAVHLAAPMDDGWNSLAEHFEAMGVELHDVAIQRTGLNPLRDLQALWQLYRLMRRERPQLMLAYTVKPVIWGLLAAWLAGVPKRCALITGLGYAFTSGREGFTSYLVRFLYRLALSRAEKVFFQNPDDEALFKELHILPSSTPSLVVNGSGIDLDQFAVAPKPAEPVFLLIARLLGDKGVREYVNAARKVKVAHPDTVFKLAGWIDENPNAIEQSELDSWIDEGIVEYLGKLADVRPALATSSVYVLPSYREGTPRTVLEAMAMGRPIITTDAPGCRETVVEGVNGYLVPVKSVDCLAGAMLRFVEDSSLIESMGHASRRIAEEKYDVHKINEIMLTEMGVRTSAR